MSNGILRQLKAGQVPLGVRQSAERGEAGLMEVILINLMRLLRSPFVLKSLERNPNSTPDVKRRLKEIREEFFEKRNNFIPIHRTKAEERALEVTSTEEPETSTA